MVQRGYTDVLKYLKGIIYGLYKTHQGVKGALFQRVAEHSRKPLTTARPR